MKTTLAIRARKISAAALVFFVAGTILMGGCGAKTQGPLKAPVPPMSPTATAAIFQEGPLAKSEPSKSIRFEHFGQEQGLSQNVVNCILQDRTGFMWFGTEDGLNRYAGYNFEVYKPDSDAPSSPSDRWITTLLEDHLGNIWFGTRQGGVNKYDPQTGTFTWYVHNSSDPGSLINNYVHALYEDRAGMLWIGTSIGLDRLDPTTGRIDHYQQSSDNPNSLSSDNITAISEDRQGNLWIGTADTGLNSFNPSTQQFVHYQYDPQNPGSLSNDTVHSIQIDQNGSLWISTADGLNRLETAEDEFVRIKLSEDDANAFMSDHINQIHIDRSGNIWTATQNGLDFYQVQTNKIIHYQHDPAIPYSLSNNTILALYEDREGTLWVGTFGGGVDVYHPSRDRFAFLNHDPNDANSLSSDLVNPIHVDRFGSVWIGTYGSGLNRYDPSTNRVARYRHDPSSPNSLGSDYISAIYRDDRGVLWVGTDAGLDRFDFNVGAVSQYVHIPADPGSLSSNTVTAIYEDKSGSLWVGTALGLDLMDRGTGQFTHYRHRQSDERSLSDNSVVTIYEDREGRLWIGTFNGGLNRYDGESEGFAQYQHDPEDPYSLGHDTVLSIFQDKTGILWIGTAGGGLSRYESNTDSFYNYTEKNGLPSNVVYGILEDGLGRLWLSTNNGISRFDPQTGVFRNYTVDDGLQSNGYNLGAYAQDGNGRMYFAGNAGVIMFDPNAVVDSTYLPPVVLTSLAQNGVAIPTGKTVETTTEFTLRWPQNSFEFEFCALGYTNSAKNQYAYMLENFDANWHYIGTQRNGRYTNLPGGEYVLHLKAANSDGVWNEKGIAVQVKVIPPFWQTWWFRGTIAAALLALFYGGYQMRTKTIQRRNLELERLILERTREMERLFEQTKELAILEERNRLARELHDSAKQKAFAALAQLGAANEVMQHNPVAARDHLSEAENLVYEVIEELTFLIQEMYPLALKDKGLVTTVREYVFEWENRTDIQADIRIENERRLPLEVEQAIYRIIQEALSNVARHSRATQVEVVISYLENMVETSIIDNGCGFKPDQTPSGMGLRSIRERIESIDGDVQIESAPGHGSRVTVRVPIKLKSN